MVMVIMPRKYVNSEPVNQIARRRLVGWLVSILFVLLLELQISRVRSKYGGSASNQNIWIHGNLIHDLNFGVGIRQLDPTNTCNFFQLNLNLDINVIISFLITKFLICLKLTF